MHKGIRILRAVGLVAIACTILGCGGGGGSNGGNGGGDGSQSVSVTTVAGIYAPSGGSIDATGVEARFDCPEGIISDGTNLYVADSNNCTIRKIVIATGAVTTFAGTADISGSKDGTGPEARFDSPSGITSDGTNLYVTDPGKDTIRKISIATGEVTTLAGKAGASGSTDGTGTAARFDSPTGITCDGSNLYVTDNWNHTIRKIVIATGEVTTFAGTAGESGSANDTGSAARFNYPEGIICDGTNLYVTDSYNNSIRKIVIATKEVSTFAGSNSNAFGSTDGTGTAARFNHPGSITINGTDMYVADTLNYTLRKIVIATREVTTIAGKAVVSGSVDGTGSAARFYKPHGILLSGTILYVSDTWNNTIRKVDIATNAVTTLAGTASTSGSADGTGTAARFYNPGGIASDGTNLYIADTANYIIRKIVIATGVVTTLAGTAGEWGSVDGTGAAARFHHPGHIIMNGADLYVSDGYTIRKIVIATGEVTTLAGITFTSSSGITCDGTNLYAVDVEENTIHKIVIATNTITTIAGTAGEEGTADGTGAAARFDRPHDITNDGVNLYVTDYWNCTIRKIVIATGEVTTFAGSAGHAGTGDGTGKAARFFLPIGIVRNGENLYVTDNWNQTIRKIVISTGEVTTLAGTAGIPGFIDGSGTIAQFNYPEGITSDGTDLYVADTSNCKIRKIEFE